MSEVRLDEGYAEHPKVVGLSDAAFSMEVRAMCYSARYSTDGFVPGGALRRLTWSSSPQEVAGELVAANRWHRADVPCPQGHDDTCPTLAGEGWRIHDYLDDNPSSEQRRSRRAAGAARMRRSRERARADTNQPDTNQPDANPAAAGRDAVAEDRHAGRPPGAEPAGTRPLRPVRDGQP